MRPMALEFPDDPAAAYLDRQYMLGADILVAPVFTASGEVEFYLPEGEWTSLLTGERAGGGRWLRETHGFDSLPLYVRPGAVIPWGAREDRPDYDYLDGLRLRVFSGGEGQTEVTVTTPDGRAQTFAVDTTMVTE
jgi:alpha-D-xyloside xylohydrolase